MRSAPRMSPSAPATLTLVGEVAAGRPFAGTVGSGEATRIFTGGVMPRGADTVVIQEHTSRADGTVVVGKPTGKGRNVRPRGSTSRPARCCCAGGSASATAIWRWPRP